MILSSTSFGFKCILILSFSKTSAEPHLEERALLPCFATFIPILDNSNEEAVEMFKVFFPSPPVPHVSTILFEVLTFRALSLNA